MKILEQTHSTNTRKGAPGWFGGFYCARGVFVGLGGGAKEVGRLGAVRRDAFPVGCCVCGGRCVVQGDGTDPFFGQCEYSPLPTELAFFCRSVGVGVRFGGFVLCNTTMRLCNTGLRHCIVFWAQCMTGAGMCSFCRGQEISCNGCKRRYRGMERRCTV